MKRILLIAAMLFPLLSGCSPDNGDGKDNGKPNPVNPSNGGGQGGNDTPDNPDNPDPPAPSGPYFRINGLQDIYVYTSPEQGSTLLVETNVEGWTATSGEPWCNVTATPSNLVIIVSEFDARQPNGQYDYLAPRSCPVHIQAGEVFDKTIMIYQECRTILSTGLYGKPVLISPDGGTVDLPVTTNCYSWTPTTDAAWLTLTRVGNTMVRITSSERKDGEEARKATVTLTSDADAFVKESFTVADSDASLEGESYDYGDHTDWD